MSQASELTTLLERIVASGAEFVLVGGLAAVAQGAPITTYDVDVVQRRTPENVERLAPAWEIFATVTNLFDRRYENFAILGANVFNGPDRTFGPALGLEPVSEQFRSVGTPRGAWLGVRYAFGDGDRAR